MIRGCTVLLLATLALSACKREDMYTQPKNVTWSESGAFPQAARMLHPVAGTVPRDPLPQSAPEPSEITADLLARGQNRYDIYCAPCHARTGDGKGMIVERGFPKPPQLFSPKLIKAKASTLYDVITRGHGAMYGFAARVAPADRWAIIAYIRALQLSQNADVAKLPATERQALQAATTSAGP